MAQNQIHEPRPVTNPRPGSAAAALRDGPAPIVITDKPYRSRAGNLGTTMSGRENLREKRARYLQELTKERASGNVRMQGMAVYQPKDGGTPLLTNRIQKYESLSGYQRIRIKFDPIIADRHWGATFGKYTDSDIHKYVTHYAKLYNVDESLVHAMIKVESGGNPYAVSPKGACGLMQLMPGTAADLQVNDVFNPAENIGGGTQYISKLLSLFDNNYKLALAGYNAGPETVRQYGCVPPIRETQNYVGLVMLYWEYFKENGNSFPYKKYDADLSPTVIKQRKKERLETHEIGDVSKSLHEIELANGSTQKASSVRQQGNYLYLFAGGRTFRLNKQMVLAVDGDSVNSDRPVLANDLAAVPDATVPLPPDAPVQLATQI